MADISHKLQTALLSQIDCDAGLLLQSGNIFKCHSLVLKLNSTFFRSKFKDEWSDKSDLTEVRCDQFEDNVVINTVKYMYGIPCLLEENTIQDYLGCSVYLGVMDFIQICDNFLKKSLCCANVFVILKVSSLYGRDVVSNLCYELLDKNFEESIAASDSFCLLDRDLVISIIKRPSLSVHEEFLFSCLVSYCEALDYGEFLSCCAQFISFSSMSLEFFVSECIKHKVLSDETQNKILLYLSSALYPVADIQNICFHPRNVICSTDCVAYRSYQVSDSKSWKSDELNGDRIQFRCDTSMKLKAVNIFGSPHSSAFFTLAVYSSESNILLGECCCRVDFFEGEVFKGVLLKKYVSITENRLYTLTLRTKGEKTYFGVNCVSRAGITMLDGRTAEVEFTNAVCGSSSSVEGQFHSLVFYG